jgi:TP901 family phage tail tape measure protein
MPTTAPIKIPIVGDDKFSKQFKQVVEQTKAIGGAITSAGKGLTAAVTAPLIGLGALSAKAAMEFNRSMANVGTLIPGQVQRLNELKGGVQGLAVSMGKSTQEMSTGLYQTISAFGDGADTMARLEVASKAATAGMATTEESINLLSAMTKGYGDTSAEATQKASDLALLTVRSIGKTIPIAASLGVTQEELAASFATLTGVTGNTAEVATQITSIFGGMVKPSELMNSTVKKLGYSSAVAMVQEQGLTKSLEMLSQAVDGDAAKMAKLLGRKEALTGALALTGSQADIFTEKLQAMQKAAGTTDAAMKEHTDGLGKTAQAWGKIKASMEVFQQKIGDKLLPVLARLFAQVEPLLDKFTGLSDSALETGIKFAGMAAAVGPVLMVVGKLVSLGAGLAPFVASLQAGGAAAAMLTGPVGIAAAAVVGLAAATAYFWDELKPVRDMMKNEVLIVFKQVKPLVKDLAKLFKGGGKSAKGLVKELAPLAAVFGSIHMKLLTLPLKGFIMQAKISAKVWRILLRIFNEIKGPLGKLVDAIKDRAMPYFKTLLGYVQGLKDALHGLTSPLGSVVDKVNEWLDAPDKARKKREMEEAQRKEAERIRKIKRAYAAKDYEKMAGEETTDIWGLGEIAREDVATTGFDAMHARNAERATGISDARRENLADLFGELEVSIHVDAEGKPQVTGVKSSGRKKPNVKTGPTMTPAAV